MTWRTAFLLQADSDNAVRQRLNDAQVPYSHQLHYLQMVTEKLAKGLSISPTSQEPPQPVHSGFVRLLQTLKGQSFVRKRLGYNDQAVFRNFINSLLGLARDIEQLAPALAGFTRPNAEYPWRDLGSRNIVVPVQHDFSAFDPRSAKMIKLEGLLAGLLRLEA